MEKSVKTERAVGWKPNSAMKLNMCLFRKIVLNSSQGPLHHKYSSNRSFLSQCKISFYLNNLGTTTNWELKVPFGGQTPTLTPLFTDQIGVKICAFSNVCIFFHDASCQSEGWCDKFLEIKFYSQII
jgi:hypothetical protein